MSDPRKVRRRTMIGGMLLAPALLSGCPGPQRPPHGYPVPPPSPGDTDLPQNGAYRFDFGGEVVT